MNTISKFFCICLILILVGVTGCSTEYITLSETTEIPSYINQLEVTEIELPHSPRYEPKHAILHINHEEFIFAITRPRQYEVDGVVMAGIVPHHITASTMISGFFELLTPDFYDLVIILAPNHEGVLADVVTSYRHWDIGNGVFTNQDFIDALLAENRISTVISHHYMEFDHSASILIPFIYYYLPNVQVAPLLLNRTLSLERTIFLFNWLNDWIIESNKNILLLCSIDFSHFLTQPEAMARDIVTKEAIERRNFHKIHTLCDFYLDSPASLIIFLMYIDELNLQLQIIDHSDATEFLGMLDETTSYMIIVGVE